MILGTIFWKHYYYKNCSLYVSFKIICCDVNISEWYLKKIISAKNDLKLTYVSLMCHTLMRAWLKQLLWILSLDLFISEVHIFLRSNFEFPRLHCWQSPVTSLLFIVSLTKGWCAILGVPATSRILMADTYFVQLFMRIPKIWFFSRLDTPNRRPSSAQLACSVLMSNQAGPSLGVDWVCPILKRIMFLESSWKIVQNMYRPAQLYKFFLKVGTPTWEYRSYFTCVSF